MTATIELPQPRDRAELDMWVRRGCALVVAAVAAYSSYEHDLPDLAGRCRHLCALVLTTAGSIAPDWSLGLLCGLGGLAGGYLGARLQPHLPDTVLRLLLGVLAIALAALYTVQSL